MQIKRNGQVGFQMILSSHIHLACTYTESMFNSFLQNYWRRLPAILEQDSLINWNMPFIMSFFVWLMLLYIVRELLLVVWWTLLPFCTSIRCGWVSERTGVCISPNYWCAFVSPGFQLTIADTSNYCILPLCILWAASFSWSAQGKEIGSTGEIDNRHCLSSEFIVESVRTDTSFFSVDYRCHPLLF